MSQAAPSTDGPNHQTLSTGPVAAQRRKHISKACEACRRRRVKCDGQRPFCTRCAARQLDCQYRIEEDGRRPASKSYVDLLRGRINSLEQLLRSHAIDVPDGMQALRPGAGGSFDALLPVDEELSHAFEGALSLDDALNYDQDGEVRYFGPSSGRLDFRSEGASPASTSDSCSQRERGGSTVPREFNVFLQEMESDIGISKELQNHLIDLYFKWLNPIFPVVDEELFRTSLDTGGRYCSHLLLTCILAVGSRLSDNESLRSDPSDPNTAGKVFEERAAVFLHYDLKAPTITTIQSVCLLETIYTATGADAIGSLHQGMAIRLAIDMGFNLDAERLGGASVMPMEEIQLRRDIYWALYCDDKLSAIYTGRVCTMLSHQGLVQLPSFSLREGAEPTRWSKSRHQVVLLHRPLIAVAKIIEKIIMSLYAPQATHKGARAVTFFHATILELKTWLYDLPVELRIDKVVQEDDPLPALFTLHMIYHTASLLLTKPFLAREQSQILRETERETLKIAHRTCYEAATHICIAARKYMRIFGGFRQSPLPATYCSLSGALVFLQTEKLNLDVVKMTGTSGFNTCIQVLQELSTSWYTAKLLRNGLLGLQKRMYPEILERSQKPEQIEVFDIATEEAGSQGSNIITLQNFHSIQAQPGSVLPVSTWDTMNLDLNTQLDRSFPPESQLISEQDSFDPLMWSNITLGAPFVPLPYDYYSSEIFDVIDW